MITLEDARRAKQKAADDLAFRDGIVGIGLTEMNGAYAIKINVETTADLAAIPGHVFDVPVMVEVVGAIIALNKS